MAQCVKLAKAGYGVEELRAVIRAKVAEWSGTEQARFLRPSTLLRLSKFEQYLAEDVGQQQPAGPSHGLVSATQHVLDGWRKYTGQPCSVAAWTGHVRRALAAGYTAEELRGACWGASESMADAPEILAKCSPGTVLRLDASDGKRTLAQWLDLATVTWAELNPGKTPPWRRDAPAQPTLSLVGAESAPEAAA